MDANGYEVAVELVDQHARNMVRITGQLDPALQAAQAQSVPDEAFGMICAEIGISGWLVAPVHDRGVATVTNAVARAEEIKGLLEATARGYDALEAREVMRVKEQDDRL